MSVLHLDGEHLTIDQVKISWEIPKALWKLLKMLISVWMLPEK